MACEPRTLRCWYCLTPHNIDTFYGGCGDASFRMIETDEGIGLIFCDERCIQKHIRYWIEIFDEALKCSAE